MSDPEPILKRLNIVLLFIALFVYAIFLNEEYLVFKMFYVEYLVFKYSVLKVMT